MSSLVFWLAVTLFGDIDKDPLTHLNNFTNEPPNSKWYLLYSHHRCVLVLSLYPYLSQSIQTAIP